MIVKCTKTGKILATEEEMKEHAEAFGVTSFEEIVPEETRLWINHQSGKYCFSKNEMDVYCRRTGEDASNFSEINVSEYLRIREQKQKTKRNDARVEKFANEKFLSALVDVKGYTVVQAEKALWFTRNESLAKAEAWLKENCKANGFNEGIMLGENDAVPESLTASSSPAGERVPMDSYIEKSLVAELVNMGFPETRAKRAVWKTCNEGVEKAVDWLTLHADDEDIDGPLPEEVEAVPQVSKLSREEAQKAALDLQRKLREERLVREAAEAKEKEKQRIIQSRALMEQQALLEEQRRKREIQERERQKKQDEDHRKELAEKLRLDFVERFGYEPPPPPAPVSVPAASGKPKDKILALLNQMRKRGTSESRNPKDLLIACLSTVRIYLGNVASNSTEKRFHKINIANRIFSEKVQPVPEAIELLRVCGFQTTGDGSALEIPNGAIADGYLCGEAVKYIDVILRSL